MQEPESRQPIIQCVLFIIFIAAPAAQPAASAGGGQPPLLTFYFLLLNPQGRAGRSHRRRRPAILDRICVLRWLQARDKSFGLKSRQPVATPGEGLLSSSAAHRWLRTAATKAAAPIFNFPLSIFNFQFAPWLAGPAGRSLRQRRPATRSSSCALRRLLPEKNCSVSCAARSRPGRRAARCFRATSPATACRNKGDRFSFSIFHFQFSIFNFQFSIFNSRPSLIRIFGCAEDTQSRQCSNKFGFRALDYTYLWLRPRYSRSAETNLAVCFCARLFVSLSPENAKTRKR